jgi:hypothetical protein
MLNRDSPQRERILLRQTRQLVLKSGRRMIVRTRDVSGSGVLVQSVLPIKIDSTVRLRAKTLPASAVP